MTERSSAADLSRLVSHALRHEPWLYELELDDEGWVDLGVLAQALRRERAWGHVTSADLERMVASASKQRHEVSGGRIRALYGHSVPGRILRVPGVPPELLFHGTSPEALATITDEGLRPMGRQYVHLSVDRDTARAVGARKDPRPVILVVSAGAAARAGVEFFRGNANVWLANTVPAEFLKGEPRSEDRTGDRDRP